LGSGAARLCHAGTLRRFLAPLTCSSIRVATHGSELGRVDPRCEPPWPIGRRNLRNDEHIGNSRKRIYRHGPEAPLEERSDSRDLSRTHYPPEKGDCLAVLRRHGVRVPNGRITRASKESPSTIDDPLPPIIANMIEATQSTISPPARSRTRRAAQSPP